MRAKPLFWFVLTSLSVGALVFTVGVRHRSSGQGVAVGARHQSEGFDQPGAAAWHDLQRRIPADGADMPALYEQASASLARLQRFASRINRTIPAAQPAARVWLGDDRASTATLRDRSAATGILDAWTNQVYEVRRFCALRTAARQQKLRLQLQTQL